MEKILDERILKNAELILRLVMIVILFTAGLSKFFSEGDFQEYYLHLFQDPRLRLQVPGFLAEIYLEIIPFLEIGIAILLLINKVRRTAVILFIAYFLSLVLGHYIIEEFAEVNALIPYFILAVFDYILPGYKEYWEIFYKE